MQAFLDKEKTRARNNKIKNRPIVIMTYVMVLTFIGMFSYIIYFMVTQSDKIIANTSNKRQDSYSKFVVRGDIVTSDDVVIATTNTDDEGNETRVYPYASLFAHSVGYNKYGRAGLELTYNFDMLRSHVNIFQKVMNDLNDEKNPGDTVVTTLNYNLQKTAAESLGGAKGAVVVLEADSGRVLAMYSNPSFDPNDMDNVWESVHSEEGSTSTVLLNRATQGLYAPGSTFKVLTAMEYIREHPDYESYTHTCNGTDIFNDVSIRCSNSTVHGQVDLKTSLAQSCNTSFANIGVNEIKINKLHGLCEDFLYNKDLPLDVAYSGSSFTLNKKSDKSQIPQTVIGQGDTLISPMHNALIMQAIANGGVMMKPRFVDRIENADGTVMHKEKNKAYGTVVDADLTKKVIPLMEEVCTTGTAARFMAGKPYTVAGKTGTAEYDNNGNCNSWFVGFMNVDNPEIVVSVIVEDYNSNQISGTYVASRIFDQYYGDNNK